MKILVLTFTICLISFTGIAQQGITNNNQTNNSGGNSRPNQLMTMKKDYSDIPAEGSPYLVDKYVLGEIFMDGELQKKSLMRYNAFRDEFEIKENDGSNPTLLKRPYISVSLSTKKFVILDFEDEGKLKQGYFNPLNQGSTILYFRPKKKLTKAKEPKAGLESFVPARYVDDSDYYLKKGNNPAKKIKLNKSKILDFFQDKSSELKTYINENKLKLKTEAEVIKLLDYYNSIQEAN